jgi:hypothetical protein
LIAWHVTVPTSVDRGARLVSQSPASWLRQ